MFPFPQRGVLEMGLDMINVDVDALVEMATSRIAVVCVKNGDP